MDGARAALGARTSSSRALLTTINEAADRVAMHAVRLELLEAQADALGCRSGRWPSPRPVRTTCTSARWRPRSRAPSPNGFTHVAFGGSLSRGHPALPRGAARRDRADADLPALRRRHAALAREMIAGRPARPHHVRRSARPDRGVRGTRVRRGAARRPAGLVDPCGERGEFHSFAYAGPMFSQPVRSRRRTSNATASSSPI